MEQTQQKSEEIKAVLDAIFGGIKSKETALAAEVIASGRVSPERVATITTVEEFFFALVHPYQKFLNGFVTIHFKGGDDAQWLFTHHNFVERHFRKIIQAHEGMACCADKSRTIIHHLAMWELKRIKKIEWDYSQEYTFHLPKTVFTTHNSVVDFYKSLRLLYYGDPGPYLNFIANGKYLAGSQETFTTSTI